VSPVISAAGSVRDRIFLGQERTHRDGTAGAVLLDGIDGVAQFAALNFEDSTGG